MFILDEPTHGIDVGTKSQVHQRVSKLAEAGYPCFSSRPTSRKYSPCVIGYLWWRQGGSSPSSHGPRRPRKGHDSGFSRPHVSERRGGTAVIANTSSALARRISTTLSRNTLRLRVFSVLLSLVAMLAVFALTTPNFLNLQNLKVIAFNASLLTIVACGESIVVITRNLDVSVGSIIGFSGFHDSNVCRGESTRGAAHYYRRGGIGFVLGPCQRFGRGIRPGAFHRRYVGHPLDLPRIHLYRREGRRGAVRLPAAVDDQWGRRHGARRALCRPSRAARCLGDGIHSAGAFRSCGGCTRWAPTRAPPSSMACGPTGRPLCVRRLRRVRGACLLPLHLARWDDHGQSRP